jgi:hypothetical protein
MGDVLVIVEVEWVDSMILDHGEWLDSDDVDDAMSKEGMTHKTVGYQIKENDHSILVASSVGQSDRIQGAIVIPKVSILTIGRLKEEQ